MLNEQILTFFRGFRRDAHPMAVLCGAIGGLSSFYYDSAGHGGDRERLIAAHRLIAKMPTIAAIAYKYACGQPFMYPQNALSYPANLMHMTFAVPAEPYLADDVLTRALDRFLILHADHGQNASTSAVRLAGSTGANPFACIAAGVAALWGPAHGGANERVLAMLDEIGSKDRIPEFIGRAKDQDDPFRLMGFGHRVYKNFDPRATIIRGMCHKVLKQMGRTDSPLFDLALELEQIALKDEYFIEKNLYPNVDFYSGITLRALGFPVSMFTALFAVARCAGWIAQWLELATDPELRIGRPRQVYTGPEQRYFAPIDQR